MKVTKWLNSYVLPNATAPHLAKTGKAQCEHMFSASPLRADIAQCRRHVRFVPKSELCVDGDVGLTARSEAALEPPRFSSLVCSLAGVHLSVVKLGHGTGLVHTGLAPDGVARLVVIPGCSRPR